MPHCILYVVKGNSSLLTKGIKMSKQTTTVQDVIDSIICVCDNHHGIYIPSRFLNDCETAIVDDKHEPIEDGSRLAEAIAFVKDDANLQEDGYWDEWDYITQNIKLVSQNDFTTTYFLHIGESGDLFAISDILGLLDDAEQEEFWENMN